MKFDNLVEQYNSLPILIVLCGCGGLLLENIEFDNIEKELVPYQNVILWKTDLICHDKFRNELKKKLAESKIKKVIVVACSFSAFQKEWSKIVNFYSKEAIIEILNIRECCVLVHQKSSMVTEKAKALIRGALAKIQALKKPPKNEVEVEYNNKVLIIGGGVAGQTAALKLANLGIYVYLIENKPWLGGNALLLSKVFPTDDCGSCVSTCDINNLNETRNCLRNTNLIEHDNITLLTNTTVQQVNGSAGNFTIELKQDPNYIDPARCIICGKCEEACPVEVSNEFDFGLSTRKLCYYGTPLAIPRTYTIERKKCPKQCFECVQVCPTKAISLEDKPVHISLDVGTIIVATGFKEFAPYLIKEYRYGRHPDVVTQFQLARMLDPVGPTDGKILRPSNSKLVKKVIIIQCVGSRDKYHNYCSEICCMVALKHAKYLKESFDIDVTICYLDIRAHGEYEKYYRSALELGVKFIRGRPTNIIPNSNNDYLQVRVEDTLLGRNVAINADLIVLSTALIPPESTKGLVQKLGISCDERGFFQSNYSKNMIHSTSKKGILIAGGARGATDIPNATSEGQAVAAEVIYQVSKSKTINSKDFAAVDGELCNQCEICAEICPWDAISLDEKQRMATVNATICDACGQCTAFCATGAIKLTSNEQLVLKRQLDAMILNNPIRPLIVAYVCEKCAYAAIEIAGAHRLQFPVNVHILTVPCAGKVSLIDIFCALASGWDGVLIGSCPNCHHKAGYQFAQQQLLYAKSILIEMQIKDKRIDYFQAASGDPRAFIEAAISITKSLS